MKDKFITVLTTTDKKEEAEKIASHLLRKRLVGCVQIIGPITSSYWWKGSIETAEEWLCLMKTEESLYAQIEEVIKEIHSYDVPEIVALPIIQGSEEYLRWLDGELKK